MRDELFTARSDTDILERKQVDAPTEMSPEPERAEKEELFARFSHRKHSQGTVTTWALSGSGTLDQVNASAVFPTANAPVVEDEIWDEYNDLLGDDSYSAPPQDNSPVSQVNLRVESMTVSKWLTFGHVLFSPARDELVPGAGPPLKSHSVLVIDGLGNDDWSYYASGTYPAATFFNLSSRAPPVRHRRSIAAMLPSPTNHHQVRYGSHLNKLPHGPESFTTVVYRFPVAAPEAHYHNVVAEARRVLRPGGFVELVVLDVDLVNMGPRCRRAVRCLKERIRTAEPDTCPGAASDTVARLLGRTGFTDIKTCRVGVPVASAIARPAGAALTGEEGASADARITKMVTRVGRWWYTRCYEHVAAGASIWADRTLLAECEEWGTKLKLMVCHARVPDVRRMASL
ncbi:hypothetical protein P8C59_006661 [Phyllachora maydis]|uniref:Methyltransferase type 11 domain-containing protein n=1 Tax=Phyllachora maydis TaxID=1825666 RepID=A0AAD9MCR6_9PEZI|nr:hypothetical protein P8C59_006661 [Phyllachora maydis]